MEGQTLLTDGRNVAETAGLLGYGHPQHFTRQLKDHFGLTPTAFRRNNWTQIFLRKIIHIS